MSPASAVTQAAWSGDKYTDHNATPSFTLHVLQTYELKETLPSTL